MEQRVFKLNAEQVERARVDEVILRSAEAAYHRPCSEFGSPPATINDRITGFEVVGGLRHVVLRSRHHVLAVFKICANNSLVSVPAWPDDLDDELTDFDDELADYLGE